MPHATETEMASTDSHLPNRDHATQTGMAGETATMQLKQG